MTYRLDLLKQPFERFHVALFQLDLSFKLGAFGDKLDGAQRVFVRRSVDDGLSRIQRYSRRGSGW